MILVVMLAFLLVGLPSPECKGEFSETGVGYKTLERTLIVNASGSGDYTHIQWAIDNASEGDTVYVEAGTYYEILNVNKSINLIGTGKDKVTIDGQDTRWGVVMYVTSDWVNVSGFKIINSHVQNRDGLGAERDSNIRLQNVRYCRIENNNCSDNEKGIYLRGSDHNYIANNTCTQNYKHGISLDYSYSNLIFNNTCTDGYDGLYFGYYSSDNLIESNTFSNSIHGIGLAPTEMDMDIYNMSSLDQNTRGFSASENIINNNTCSNCDIGIGLYYYSSTNRITNNTCISNRQGMVLDKTRKNNISKNIFRSNEKYGVQIAEESESNLVHNNDFIYNNGNGDQALDDGILTIWNDSSGKGNFWTDYKVRYPYSKRNGPIWKRAYKISGLANSNDDFPLARSHSIIEDTLPEQKKDNTPKNFFNGDKFTLEGIFQDNLWVNMVWVNCTYNDKQFYVEPLETRNSKLWNITIVMDSEARSFSYYFIIEDATHNIAFTKTKKIGSIDNIKPKLIDGGPLNQPTTGDNITFIANCTDNIRVKEVFLLYSFDDLIFYNESMKLFTNQLAKCIISIWPNALIIKYYFIMGDTSGNYNFSRIFQTPVYDNDEPMAFSIGDATINQHDIFHFEAGASDDNIGIMDYTWNFIYDQRKIRLSGESAPFRFDKVDVYEVTLNVTDTSLNWNENKFKITVLDITLPIANAGNNVTTYQGETVFFNGSGSTDNFTVLNYSWSFVYLEKNITLFGAKTRFRYRTPGNYTVILTVRKTIDLWDEDFIWVNVLDNENPHAEVGGNISIQSGCSVHFNGTGSWDNHCLENYTWSFRYKGAEVFLYGMDPIFQFMVPGNYTITLRVTDSGGNYDEELLYLTVQTGEVYEGGHVNETDDNLPDDDTTPKLNDDGFNVYFVAFVFISITVCVGAYIYFLKGQNKTSESTPSDDDLGRMQESDISDQEEEVLNE